MTHLTSEQLVEAAEGVLSAERTRHLEQCEVCRTNVDTLRAVLSDVGDTSSVPEPSPLFWEHLSRRVREATAAERVPAPERWWHAMWRPVIAFGAVAGAVALAVLLRSGGSVQPTVAVEQAQIAAAAGDLTPSDDTVDVVTAVVGDLSFDELRAADLVPSRGAVDLAVSSLSEAQQRELMRLVREELIGSE
ncbi:MAG TPA: hypothetical protein VJN96_15715 [Vicinamibacterales bacterium]|nr:hypothetical protein [Vicinamibacterales bacterium]